MKTIAFCNSTLAWGGGETWHLEASLYLLGQGYKVLMMAHEEGALYARAKAYEGPHFTLIPLSIGRLSFLNPFTVKKYARFLSSHGVDAVLMNLPQDLKCMGLAARKAGISQVIYRRGSALPVRNSALNRYLYGKVLTGLIVNSQATKNEVYRHNSRLISEKRVMVLPNGIDISDFDRRLAEADCLDVDLGMKLGGKDDEKPEATWDRGGDRGQQLRHERVEDGGTFIKSSSAPIVLGNAGRLNKQKGQHFLLYLSKALETMDVDYRLVIAGSGERRQELEELAQNLGVADKVFFTGFLQDTCPFWKSIDVFVLTSLWEGFGYVLLEAMLSAKPILAFGVSNIPELVEDGNNGFLFPLPLESAQGHTDLKDHENMGQGGDKEGSASSSLPDMSAMAEAVKRLAHDPALRKRMGEAGRSFADPAFDQKVVMTNLMEYLEKAES